MKEVGKLVVIKIYNKRNKIKKCFTSLKQKYKIKCDCSGKHGERMERPYIPQDPCCFWVWNMICDKGKEISIICSSR